MKKYLVRGSTNKVFYDMPTLEKARKVAKDECEVYPGRLVEIYQIVETAKIPIQEIEYTKT